MKEVKYLSFGGPIERAISLYKLRKDNPSMKVLKKGTGSARCCGTYYSALAELQCKPTLSKIKRDTVYFYSLKDREEFIANKLSTRPHHSVLLKFSYVQRFPLPRKRIFGVTFESD